MTGHQADHTVTFEDGPTVEVPDNANLREVCLREGVALYGVLARVTNCGGKAKCGTCRMTVIGGTDALSRPTPFERDRKGDEGLQRRLACQAAVRGDVTVRRGW